MILFFENGRLGNQLFQYVGIKKFFPNQKIVLFGCEDLLCYFDGVDASFISKKLFRNRAIYEIFKRIIHFFARMRILGSIVENLDSPQYNIDFKKGLVPNIFVPQDVFFQHRSVADSVDDHPILRYEILQKAEQWLSNKGVNIKNSSLVFVHVRRGDYMAWPSKEFPAILDAAWYKRAMRKISDKIDRPIFVLMSDDGYYLRDIFIESDSLIISNNMPVVDLAIMSYCIAGVMSASSFGWWGGFMAKNRNAQNVGHSIFIAPNYWGGHRARKWFPRYFVSSWIDYMN